MQLFKTCHCFMESILPSTRNVPALLVVYLNSLMPQIPFSKNCLRQCSHVRGSPLSNPFLLQRKRRMFSSVSCCWSKGNGSVDFSRKVGLCFLNHLVRILNSLELVLASYAQYFSNSFITSTYSDGLDGPSKHTFPIFLIVQSSFQKKVWKSSLNNFLFGMF